MRKYNLFLASLILFVVIISGCSLMGGRTTNFTVQPGEQDTIPAGLPVRVTVVPLSGDETLTEMTEKIITNRLPSMGFDVVNFDIIREKISTRTLIPYDFLNGNSRRIMKDEFGIEAVFSGHITTKPEISNHLGNFKLELMEIENASALWCGRLENQKWSAKEARKRKSASRTVSKMMKILEI